MFEITKEFHFSASHVLEGLEEGHPCGRLHGHNYIIRIHLAARELDRIGFVTDYGLLKPIKQWIDNTLDHRHLNDVVPGNPTAENIAQHILDTFHMDFPTLVAVSVSETPKTWATYRREW